MCIRAIKPRKELSMSESNTRIDSTLLDKASYNYSLEKEKLLKYGLLPIGHKGGTVEEVTPRMIAEAAKLRADEYGKDIKVYTKELEIVVNKFINHTDEEIMKSNYRRSENRDFAEEAVQSENPFRSMLDAQSAI